MNELRISGSNLGMPAMENFCERCYWLLLKMGNKFAFQRPFPGILFHADRLQKDVVHAHFGKYRKPPRWFGPFADAKDYLETGKLVYTDPETGIELRGAPDEVLLLPNGSLAVVDYKTARHKEGKDILLPKYKAQVNSYAFLLQHQEEARTVSKGGLIYYQFRTDYDDDELLDLVTKDGLDAHFDPAPLVLELDPEKIVPALLMTTRKLFDRRTPPKGREGCKDCELLARMAILARVGQLKDQSDLERFIEFHRNRHFTDGEKCPSLDPDSIFTLWDFDEEE